MAFGDPGFVDYIFTTENSLLVIKDPIYVNWGVIHVGKKYGKIIVGNLQHYRRRMCELDVFDTTPVQIYFSNQDDCFVTRSLPPFRSVSTFSSFPLLPIALVDHATQTRPPNPASLRKTPLAFFKPDFALFLTTWVRPIGLNLARNARRRMSRSRSLSVRN